MISSFRFQQLLRRYPAQFWLMFLGMLISSTGSSLIWPFWMVYVKRTLDISLSEVALLPLINSGVALITSIVAGPMVDRFGRKWAMVFSLALNGFAYLIMSQATTFSLFILTSSLQGFSNPVYRIGADAMMADLLPSEKRVQGYSLFRLASNLGISVGPAIGGFITASSYNLAFQIAASGLIFYAILIFLRAQETKPEVVMMENIQNAHLGGYDTLFKDQQFVSFLKAFALVMTGVTLIWQLLPVYSITYFQVPENEFGFIFSTNAIMVVFLQIMVTNAVRRFSIRHRLAAGGFLYAVALFSIVLGRDFWGFLICMVIMTLGELIIVPTSSTYVADLAPEDKRGRYMGIYSLAQTMSHGVGPLMGGMLNDYLGPVFIWLGGGLVALLGTVLFLAMKIGPEKQPQPAPD